MLRYFILSIFSLFYLLFASPVWGAENWVVDSFQSRLNIQRDGRVEIIETISVNFGYLQKHGIFRDIPYIYYSENRSRIYTEIEIESVALNGQAVPVRTSKIDNYIRLQIGDANKTISGRATYKITYLATGILRSFEDHDELFWDATGNGWPVSISEALATVTIPQNGITGTVCFQGAINSKEKCNSSLLSQNQAVFEATRLLNPQEGLTIVLGYTKGMVPILTVSPSQSANASDGASVYPPNGWAFLISLFLGIVSIFWWWKKKGQEQSLGAIMAEYSAPDNLKPAEVGTILDERADTLDVSATIIDLAVQGYLTIEEKEKKWLFGSTDYILAKKAKSEDNLLGYEKELLDKIFEEDNIVKLSELKNEFYDDLAEVKQKLYKDIVDKKYFPINPEKVKLRYTLRGISVMILSVFIVVIGLFEPFGILSGFGLALIFTGFILLMFSRSFPKRTLQGNRTLGKILGFKLFMEKVETYKQRFMERENLFNELLPYAIVFGVTEKFAKAFKDLGIKPQEPTWYISSRPFNPVLFSSNINNFSNSLTSAIASQPSSKHSFVSSGSGFSRGSSGGGFGGGGGGSW